MKKKHVIFKAFLPIAYKKRKKYIVASCPVLDIFSQGDNKDEAKKNLTEAVHLFLSSCYERGTLDAVLKECGFELEQALDLHPSMEPPQDYINVPLSFLVHKPNKVSCPA